MLRPTVANPEKLSKASRALELHHPAHPDLALRLSAPPRSPGHFMIKRAARQGVRSDSCLADGAEAHDRAAAVAPARGAASCLPAPAKALLRQASCLREMHARPTNAISVGGSSLALAGAPTCPCLTVSPLPARLLPAPCPQLSAVQSTLSAAQAVAVGTQANCAPEAALAYWAQLQHAARQCLQRAAQRAAADAATAAEGGGDDAANGTRGIPPGLSEEAQRAAVAAAAAGRQAAAAKLQALLDSNSGGLRDASVTGGGGNKGWEAVREAEPSFAQDCGPTLKGHSREAAGCAVAASNTPPCCLPTCPPQASLCHSWAACQATWCAARRRGQRPPAGAPYGPACCPRVRQAPWAAPGRRPWLCAPPAACLHAGAGVACQAGRQTCMLNLLRTQHTSPLVTHPSYVCPCSELPFDARRVAGGWAGAGAVHAAASSAGNAGGAALRGGAAAQQRRLAPHRAPPADAPAHGRGGGCDRAACSMAAAA